MPEDSDELIEVHARHALGEHLYARLREAIDVSRDEVTIAQIIRGCRIGRYQWLQGTKCVEITEVGMSYEGQVLTLLYTAGDLHELREHMLPEVIAFAQDLGCVALVAHGRKGWRRFAMQYGFEVQGERFVLYLPPTKKKEE